jgi:hypothetical protein
VPARKAQPLPRFTLMWVSAILKIVVACPLRLCIITAGQQRQPHTTWGGSQATNCKGRTMATATKTASKGRKGSSKAQASKPAAPGEYGVTRSKDVPWGPKKIAVLKALKAMGATSPAKGVGSKAVADKAKVTERDVRHYCYHGAAGGLTVVTPGTSGRGFVFSLTAAGAKAKELN